jgi:hypothetical protein
MPTSSAPIFRRRFLGGTHENGPELIAAQLAIFHDTRKDRELRTVVGSPLWCDALAAPQRFTLIRHEDA